MAQTPGEKQLVVEVVAAIQADPMRSYELLNVGAGSSTSVEDQLSRVTTRFVVDRVDIEDPTVAHPQVRRCIQESVEAMPDLPSQGYDVVYGNYVFEHLGRPDLAIDEVHRVLRSGGIVVLSIPNPEAPEFRLSAWTPLWFHRLVRGGRAWEPVYAFRNVDELAAAFLSAGFVEPRIHRFSILSGYLGRVPVVGGVARVYDRFVTKRGSTRLMGDACLVVSKAT